MKNLILHSYKKVLLIGFILLAGCNNTVSDKSTKATDSTNAENNKVLASYQCPMKCEAEKTYDKPGSCPVCEMDLELIK